MDIPTSDHLMTKALGNMKFYLCKDPDLYTEKTMILRLENASVPRQEHPAS